MQTSSDWRPADIAGNNISRFSLKYSERVPISRLYSPCLNVCSRRSIRSEKYCVPRNFVDISSSSTPDRGPRFKAQSVAMWRHVQCGEVRASESLYLMRQHALYLETGEQLIRFTFFSQLNSSPAPEAQTEAIMKCQWPGSRVVTNC